MKLRIACACWCLAASVACGDAPGDDRAGAAGPSADPHLEALSEAHRDDRGDRPGAAAIADREGLPVETSEVVYATVAGRPVEGFLARPVARSEPGAPSTAGPGVLLVHEWWGLNDNMRSMARRLAGAGYTALAVDLYHGAHTADPVEARLLAGATRARESQLAANLEQAQTWLRENADASRVGVVGWCFGGGWALQAALRQGPQIDAVVVYYGRVVSEPERLASLQAPLLGIFAGRDRAIPAADARAFARTLEALGKDATVRIFETADHAFANPSGEHHAPEEAAEAWELTLGFLARTLRP